jgi:hypothetical protein
MNERSTETRWISRVAVTGGPIQKLDVAVPNARFLSMHPDGRRLAFHGGEDSTEIWVMEPAQSKHWHAACGAAEQLTAAPGRAVTQT